MSLLYLKKTLLLLSILISYHATAQIVYTDVDPDITIDDFQQGYPVDFNNDGVTDFHIVLLSNTGVWVMQLILDTSTANTFVVLDGDEAAVLNQDNNIGPSSDLYLLDSGWGDLMYGYWNSSGEYGNWTGVQEDKYLGIKFEIGNQFHYGWVQLNTTIHSHSNMEFTVKSFAYETTPNTSILAGDTGTTGVNANEIASISVYPNPTKDWIHFDSPTPLKQVLVFDSTGKLVKNINVDFTAKNLDLSEISKGIYTVKFISDNRSSVKKIIKE